MSDEVEGTPASMVPVYRALGQKIEAARAALGLLQRDVARLSGLSETTVSAIECGRRSVSLEQLGLLAKALNLSPELLVKGIFG